ncbi:MAG: KUP/HAK/KT family potassium transporter, partial [bacterium]
PRVLANMAIDSWAPRHFAALSDRLTTRNGILLMGLASLVPLFYTKGDVRQIVVMYSINVFITFSMTQASMCHFHYGNRKKDADWKRKMPIYVVGLTMCLTILMVTVFEKFTEGGWITLAVTGAVIFVCFRIRRHYVRVNAKLATLYKSLAEITPIAKGPAEPLDPAKPTAAILVGGYAGLGIHTLLNALRAFPGQFKNAVFISVGLIDSGVFKGEDTIDKLKEQTEEGLRKYVELAEGQGIAATSRIAIGTDVVAELERLCLEVAKEFPQVTFFAGQLVFQHHRWYQPLLHNETAFALQKRLQMPGHTMVIMPARVE